MPAFRPPRLSIAAPGIVPTERAVMALALAAPVALLLAALAPGSWVVAPLAGAILLALVLADSLLAGRLVEARVISPAEIEVGAEARLTVLADFAGDRARGASAALSLDPRLAPGGVLHLPLAADLAEEGSAMLSGAATIIPARRGTARITHLWLRWSGPMGLGARQHRRELAQPIRITPNIAAIRSPALQAFLRDSEFGLIARRMRGEGTVFETLAEYQPGMDRRRIDWKVSARHAHLFAREYEAERNNQIVFAFDCGQAMCEPVSGMARLDRAISAALTTAWVALKGGDKVALFGFGARISLATPFVTDTGGFHRLQSAAASLDYEPREANFTLALAALSARLQRRSLIVVFSDFSDPTSAALMVEGIGRLVSRHRVLFVTLADEELHAMAGAAPDSEQALARAVTAEGLLRQRALVLQRLRQLGVDVVEARWQAFGTRLVDAYLAIKRAGGIG